MAETPTSNSTTTPAPVGLPDFGGGVASGAPGAIGLLSDVTLQVRIELGRTKMLVEDVLRLNADSVVELDKAKRVVRLTKRVLDFAATKTEGNVLKDGHVWEQRIRLEHRIHRPLVRLQSRHVSAANQH